MNAHCPSQHSPLHSAPTASWHVVASQQAEASSHASPTSTTPLPHVAPTLSHKVRLRGLGLGLGLWSEDEGKGEVQGKGED